MRLEFPDEGNIEIYMETLNFIIGDKRQSMIDLCSCFAPNTPKLRFKKRVYVDAIHRELDHRKEQEFFIQEDVLKIQPCAEDEKYDVAFALDAIEHFDKQDGYKLLDVMESISHKQILFTPLGEVWLTAGDNPEEHKSGWWPNDVPGYASIVYPNYHKIWNFGAFFFWKCDNIEEDFKRVKNLLCFI